MHTRAHQTTMTSTEALVGVDNTESPDSEVTEATTRSPIAESKRHFHVLKHSIATRLLDTGPDLRFAQDWLGDADIQTPHLKVPHRPHPRAECAKGVHAVAELLI